MRYLLLVLLSINLFANPIADKIHKYDWNGIDVTWIEDNSLPTYDVIFYFADGALSDGPRKGETEMAFDLLSHGTNRFSRAEISDNLEFFGTQTGATVVHEYSTFNISGLAKDLIPSVKKICHLFKDATYPKNEVSKEIKLQVNLKKNLLNKHGALASIAFREISLEGTPFVHRTAGKISNIKKLHSKGLKNKLNYFNEKVKKKVYLTGPKSVLNIKNVLLGECGWKSDASFSRVVKYKAPEQKGMIHLVTVPKANQAKVVAGTFMGKGTYENFETLDVLGQYLGGGFTSVLMKELRVKRGLTYTAHASIGGQKEYGRAVINTFTKEESIIELIKVLKDILKTKNSGDISQEDITMVKNSLVGSFPFKFEKSSSFLRQLMFYDHIGVGLDRFFDYGPIVEKVTVKDVVDSMKISFPWDKVDILVLGEKNLLKILKKLGPVKVHDYKKFIY